MDTALDAALPKQPSDTRSRALLWAAGVSMLGSIGIGALSLALWMAARLAVAVAEIFRPELDPSPDNGWVVAVTVTAMVLCMASALGMAWAIAGSPPGGLPPTLVGVGSGVFGWAVGVCAFCLPMGIDPLSLLP